MQRIMDHWFSIILLRGKAFPALKWVRLACELKAKPSNLTVITQNTGADFPYLKIRKVIDGSMATGSLRAHGTKEMPVWGDVFRREGGSYSKWTDAQARMMNIVDYLASIQK